MSNEGKSNWRSSNRPYILAFVAAVIVFMLVAPKMGVGDNMSPTINDGDVTVLKKEVYSEKRGTPEYEDVVAFKRDFYGGGKRNEYSFGRVMGLPGDTIEVKNGKVMRNGKTLPGKSYEKGKTTGSYGPTKLGKEEIFILSDNREKGIDSRNDKVGPRKLNELRGKSWIRLWPLNKIGTIK